MAGLTGGSWCKREYFRGIEYLAESVVTVTGRRWSYGDGHTYCTLDVEVRN